jgi:hypothetical protein
LLKVLSTAFTQRELRSGICLKWTERNFYSIDICAKTNSVNYASFGTFDSYKTRVSLKHTEISVLLKWIVTEFSPLLQCCDSYCCKSYVSIGLYLWMVGLHHHISRTFGEWPHLCSRAKIEVKVGKLYITWKQYSLEDKN